MVKIAPSILSADFGRIAEQIAEIERNGAAYVHLDVMDGRFVPNITWGPKVISDLRKRTKLVFDCHLMIVEPERYVERFKEAGAEIITFHLEATTHAQRLWNTSGRWASKPASRSVRKRRLRCWKTLPATSM